VGGGWAEEGALMSFGGVLKAVRIRKNIRLGKKLKAGGHLGRHPQKGCSRPWGMGSTRRGGKNLEKGGGGEGKLHREVGGPKW